MPAKKHDPKQLDRFKETARQLGCDEDEAAFDEKLKSIAKAKPMAKTSGEKGA